MRPNILNGLFAPVTSLSGVGPRIGKLIETVAGPRLVDLLWHAPSGLVDRSFRPTIAEAPDGRIATLTVTVEAHLKPRTPRLPHKVKCSDATGTMELVFFRVHGDYLDNALPIGATRVVSGEVKRYDGMLQMAHPDFIVPPDEAAQLGGVEPVYPLTAGLTPRPLARAIRAAVERAPELPEWQDTALRAREKFPGWREAIVALHAPQGLADLALTTPQRRRLAYDELLASQLAVALVRARQKRLRGQRVAGDGRLRRKVLAALPFTLTGSQEAALREIQADMASDTRMMRLLQGDVGSGKTVVAFLAMLNAVEAGRQAALMAPTEILARQHFATIEPLARAADVPVALFTGRDKGASRAMARDALASGRTAIAIGTHALFQEDIEFRDLALAVIDEQHRFGVHQRLTLAEKGRAADMLVMTATPIPRTLMMTAYGDLDVSRLIDKPPGRKPVDTRAVPLNRLEEVAESLARAIRGGARVYWVCPLVEESEIVDLAAATERAAHLAQRFGGRVGLVHGKLKPRDKDQVMARFAAGDLDILVATTVIEVGVDVPAATVMVIEHAERFGLSQLHQLRGRVGRGAAASSCLLLYATPLGETARRRIEILRETEDGFRIAEEDLRLRGAGEVLGTRQSGMPTFRLADLAAHEDLLAIANDDARLILERDPELAGPRGQALRVLLYLFERDAAVQTLRSG
jgi:ATP-dependent DNA helicase RecG